MPDMFSGDCLPENALSNPPDGVCYVVYHFDVPHLRVFHSLTVTNGWRNIAWNPLVPWSIRS